MNYREAFGSVVRDLRAERDMAQEDLADQLPISQSILSKMEKGRAAVTVGDIHRVARIFGTKASVIARIMQSRVSQSGGGAKQ